MNINKNPKNNTKQIIALCKDESFKEEFINNYKNAGESNYIAELQYIAAFQTICMNESNNGITQEPPLFTAHIDSIKRVLLTISSVGLLIEPKKKEVALFTSKSTSGYPFLDFILCYRGMYKLVGLSPRVLSSCVEIVYQGDTFEWSGENQMPKYIMNFNHDKQNIVAGFCAFQMANGVVHAHLLNGEEIQELIANAIEATTAAGGDPSMWTGAWRSRSIKSKIFRSAFTFYRSYLLENRELIRSLTDEEEPPKIQDFAKTLEQKLNEMELASHE